MKLELIAPEVGQLLKFVAPEVGQLAAHTLIEHNIAEDVYFSLALDYAAGRNVPRDLIAAHKFFNLSAMRGNATAAAHRKELSLEMSKDEIALALHCARDFLAAEAKAGTMH